MTTNMSKGKVKLEVTNTYYFTQAQWAKHEEDRYVHNVNTRNKLGMQEYLNRICLPQETTTEVDMSDIEMPKEGENDMLLG
jgi:L-arabinose isomerase